MAAGALLLAASCGADRRLEEGDEGRAPMREGAEDDDPSSSKTSEEALIRDENAPDAPSAETGAGGAASLPTLVVVGSGSLSSGGGSMASPPGATVTDDVPVPEFPAVTLPPDTGYPWPGLLVDDRAPHVVGSLPPRQACSDIVSMVRQGQRTTVGMGVQFRIGLAGPAGLPLDASAYLDCLSLRRPDGVEFSESRSGAPATNALTALLVQPPATEAEQAALADALAALFLSRPRGERLALLRWGASVQQVVGFTVHRDTFNDSLARLGLADPEPLDAGTAVTVAQQMLEAVSDDAYAWTRNVVAIAPSLRAAELVAYERDVNVLWAVDTEGVSGFRYVHTTPESLRDSMAAVSARLNVIRDAGFVTFGVCGNGLAAAFEIAGGYAARGLALKDSLVEEQTAVCDPAVVRDFDHYDTQLIELSFSEAQREIYDAAVDDRDDEVEFEATVRLSPEHGSGLAMANLRGGTSLSRCPDDRMNLSIDFDGGRERFFYPESTGSVGSDEFYLTAMCLDEMYVNQLTMDRLMASFGMFVSGVKFVELRVDGKTQGVYLLMEQVKEALVRTQSNLMAVIRRRVNGPEVKLPNDEDPAGQETALAVFTALSRDIEDLAGAERLALLDGRLDLHRYMFFVALQSVIHNADWGDEPTFYGSATLGADGPTALFSVNGWDPDDVLMGECAHNDVLRDSFDMIGCAEDELEKAIFGADRRADDVLDDEVYALYADALEVVLATVTEELVASHFATTVNELSPFMADPEIIAVMPDWEGLSDPKASLDEFVEQQLAAFSERREYLLSQLELYRDSR